MAITDFAFVPATGFKDTTTFPNPAVGGARTQMQTLLDQIKDYLNGTFQTDLAAELEAIVLGQIPDGLLTDAKLSDAAGQIKTVVSVHLADTAKHTTKTYIDDADLLNAINNAKTNFKLDSHTEKEKNALGQMVIDALNDSTGINAGASSGYIYDSVNKLLKVSPTSAISQTSGSTQKSCSSADWVAQQITATAEMDGKSMLRITLKGYSKTGSGCDMPIYIYADSSDAPGSSLGYTTILAANWNATDINAVDISLSSAISSGAKYWIVARPASGGSTDRYSLVTSESDIYTSGLLKESVNSGSSWSEVSGADLYFKVEYYASASSATVIWNFDAATTAPTEAYIVSDVTLGSGALAYYISRDGGTTFTACTLETLVDISAQPSGTTIVVKVAITGNAVLNALAWGWK